MEGCNLDELKVLESLFLFFSLQSIKKENDYQISLCCTKINISKKSQNICREIEEGKNLNSICIIPITRNRGQNLNPAMTR